VTGHGHDMNGKGRVLRTGEYLVAHASRYPPASIREERQQEWMAELPAILRDPAVRPAARRAAPMLMFAADTFRGAAGARYTPRAVTCTATRTAGPVIRRPAKD
jgi:hypothetical protein